MYIRAVLWWLLLVWVVNTDAGVHFYKWVDAAGQTHFSDRPATGAQELSVNGSPVAGGGNNAAPGRVGSSKGPYSDIELVRPQEDQIFLTELAAIPIELLVLIEPGLRPGHEFQFVLNGDLVSGRFNNTKVTLNVATGIHEIYAQVIDTENRVLITSKPVKFRIRQRGQATAKPVP